MILPLLTYCGTLQLNITQTQRNRLLNFHRRVMNLCRIDENEQKHVTSPISSNVIHSLTLVRQCINGDVCNNFKNYFEVTNHGRVTRNLGYFLKLPQLKLE